MTSATNARIAGSTFLAYIVLGITEMIVSGRASKGANAAARLASMAQNAMTVRVGVLLTLLTFIAAVALAVSLYALTRDEDRDLALMALCFRAIEAAFAAFACVRTLGLLALATSAAGATGAEAAAANALGASLMSQGGATPLIAATCFALGSTIYCYLFLRARSIPVALSWLGVAASLVLVIALPMRIAGFLSGTAAYAIWLPMLVFEVTFALWLLIKGVAPASR
jgi:hypothetical protein